MSLIDKFERKFLFRLTRLVAITIIALAALLFSVGVSGYFAQFFPASVSFGDDELAVIVSNVGKSPASESEEELGVYSASSQIKDPLSGLKIPFSVQKAFSGAGNMDILRGWIEPMELSEREQFIKELNTVIKEAERQGVDVSFAINSFWQLKVGRIGERYDAEESNGLDKYFLAAVSACAIFLIAMFSLVLVLLAIERNTRVAE